MLIIILQPKDKEIRKINSIKHFYFYYTEGYAINSDIRYYIDCDDICSAKIKPYGIDEDNIKEIIVDNKFIEEVLVILNNYEVIKWDGFDRYAKDVLDGNSFSFDLITDDINIHASGYMLWPNNYKIVRDKIDSLFGNLYEFDELKN